MMDQQRRLSEPLRWTAAGRLAVAGVATALVLAALGLGIYAATGGFASKAQPGCIDVTFASTTGAAHLRACGARARDICASPQPYSGIGESLRRACEHARYPFGGTPRRP
jgi:hypothetical protein